MAKAKIEAKSNPISAGVQFVDESWRELKKVHAPTRQETIQASIVVLVMVILFALFLGAADLVVGKVMQTILSN